MFAIFYSSSTSSGQNFWLKGLCEFGTLTLDENTSKCLARRDGGPFGGFLNKLLSITELVSYLRGHRLFVEIKRINCVYPVEPQTRLTDFY